MEDKVVLLDAWASPFAMRVRIALAEKGIIYETREENLPDKSPLLLEMNPVHRKVPVLIHNGKPICESLIIVQYIDEMWPDKSPLLPSDPYQASHARFWADYIDKKIGENGRNIWRVKGEAPKVEFMEAMKILEGELRDKPFFGGDKFGFVDLALVPYSIWFYTFRKIANMNVEAECPKIAAWAKRCSEKESVSQALPDPEKIYNFILPLKRKLGLE